MFTKDSEAEPQVEDALNRIVSKLLGGEQSSKVKELLAAADEAIMQAETPGEMQRINRMVKAKIRALANNTWLKDNRT